MKQDSEQKFIQIQKAKLLALKARLTKEVYQEPDVESSQPLDEGDRAEELTELATHSAEEKIRLKELSKVKSALAKIKRGTYFRCSNCKGNIPKARLKAQPSALTCLKCR